MAPKQAAQDSPPLAAERALRAVSLIGREGHTLGQWQDAIDTELRRLHETGCAVQDVALSRGSTTQTDVALVTYRHAPDASN